MVLPDFCGPLFFFMLLSIIIPVYNERATIGQVLEHCRQLSIPKEIIVVDGHSSDGTVDRLREEETRGDLVVIYQAERRGRGNALRAGMDRASGDVIVFQDADLELDPAELPHLLEPIQSGEADVVFGSRFLRGRPPMTFLQYWGNVIINRTLNGLYGARITDVETCYQMFRADCIRGQNFVCEHFTFTVELALRFIRLGYRIHEVPISYYPRTREEGKKLYWKDGLESLWVILRTRLTPPPPPPRKTSSGS
jgi:glycosyltransferase involved in cell wall biosynthesis